MLYIKTKLSEGITLTIPIYNDEIYTKCPGCGVEHAVEPEIIAHILNEGECLESTSVYCEKCSKKETAKMAEIKTAIEQGAMTLNKARITSGLEPIDDHAANVLVKKA